MPALRCLYLAGNPVVREMRNYRKRLVAALPDLTYLDDRPVFELEHRASQAWCGGKQPLIQLSHRHENFLAHCPYWSGSAAAPLKIPFKLSNSNARRQSWSVDVCGWWRLPGRGAGVHYPYRRAHGRLASRAEAQRSALCTEGAFSWLLIVKLKGLQHVTETAC